MLDIEITQRSNKIIAAMLKADIPDDEVSTAALAYLSARLFDNKKNLAKWLKFAEWCWELHKAG